MSETSNPPSVGTASDASPAHSTRNAIEIFIRLGMIILILGWCLQIVAPFVSIVVWALIIAIAMDSPFDRLCARCGGRRSLAATLVVVLAMIAFAVPTVMLSETLVSGAHAFARDLAEGNVKVPAPAASVREWPIVGERVFESWQLASQNLGEAVVRLRPQLEAISRWLLHAAGSAGAGILQLFASLVIAGVMLARSEGRQKAILRFASRLAGEVRGPEFARLTNATVQSVVQGILGVALIQTTLAGLGFMVAGIPAAGLWALLVLVAAVVQLPVALVMLPPIFLAFSSMGTVAAVAFSVWCLAVSLIDNVLKPILFGRGVEVPMLVIFLGAIGGMLSMGIVGLFLGAVVLALGYELFRAWLEMPESA
jgi:predicted PurR-regulated permease PerM